MKFQLEKFGKIFDEEFSSLPEQVRKMSMKQIEMSNFPKSKKYVDEHVFKTEKGSYFVKMGEDKFIPYSENGFESTFGKTIRDYHPNFFKKNTVRYETEIYDEDFMICHKTRRINLANPFNFKLEDVELIAEEKELYDFLMEEYLLKVIANGEKRILEFLLNVVSCWLHRKQSQIITIFVGLGGTGKSKFAELMFALLGSGSKPLTEDVLSGKDMFNGTLIGLVLGIFEETNGKGEANYMDVQRSLKRLATSPAFMARLMQTDAYAVKNIINFLLMTNHLKDIKSDRRNFVIEPSTKRLEDKPFYAKITGIIQNKRIMQHLFNELYKREHEVWNKEIPTTEVNDDLKEQASTNPTNDFIVHMYLKESFNSEHMNMTELYSVYKDFCESQGKAFYNSRMSENIFRHQIRQMFEKADYHKANKTYYLTSKPEILKVMKRFKISDEYIERKKQEFVSDTVQEADIMDTFKVPYDNRNQEDLVKTIENQRQIIEQLREEIKFLKTASKPDTKPPAPKIKVSAECKKAWDAIEL